MVKQLIKGFFRVFGLQVNKIANDGRPGSVLRPVGDMRSLLEDLKSRGLVCHIIMDVGAHRAEWSRMANSVFPEAQLILIEPQAELEPNLKEFCTDVPRSRYYLAGAAASREEKVLTIWPDLAGSSFLPKPEDMLIKGGKQRRVSMITIDEVLEGGKVPDIIKLDIQGYELEALKGAASTFGKTDVYILEVSLFSFSDVPGMPVFSDIINFMLERDYVVYDFPGFLRRPLDGALGQCDVCFVKKNGMFRRSDGW